jgi:hypothetical protein
MGLIAVVVRTARAAPPISAQVTTTPVGVTCEIRIPPVTAFWSNIPAVEHEFAEDAIRVMHGDPLFDYWELVAEKRLARIHILFLERPKNLVTATVTIHIGDAEIDRLPAIPVLSPAEVESTGWPKKDELKAFLASDILTAANRKNLWQKLKSQVAVGEHGGWSAKPPDFAVPVRWNDHFKSYSGLLRAGANATDARIVYGISMQRSTSAHDGNKNINVLVARAQCIYMNNLVKPASAVPDLGAFELRPVYVHQAADTPLQPILIECTPTGLGLR